MKLSDLNINFLIPAFMTILGLVIGWILNELTYLVRSRRENKRQLNAALFNLLDVRFILISTDPDRFIDSITSILKRKFPGQLPKEFDVVVGQLLNTLFQGLVAERQMGEIKSIEKRYSESVDELSRIDPILAYSLSGKQKIYNYLEYLNDYFSKVDELAKNQLQQFAEGGKEGQNWDQLRERAKKALHPGLFRVAMETVTSDIKRIAREIGIVTSYRARRVISRQEHPRPDKELEELLDGYLKMLFSN
jgi:hypothetical protein